MKTERNPSFEGLKSTRAGWCRACCGIPLNEGVPGTSNTDATGTATFTYTGANQGTDTISACYKDGAPICLAVASVTKTWTDPLITASGTTFSAVEGAAFTAPVAVMVTITDTDTPTDTATANSTANVANLCPGL